MVQKIAHSMRHMNKKKGFMALKIDLEKAYDRISKVFVVRYLHEHHLPENLIHLIH